MSMFLFSHSTYAAEGGGLLSSLFKGSKLTRVAVGYGSSEFKDFSPTTITSLDRVEPYWEDVDFLMPLTFHLGFREIFEQSASIPFNGGPSKNGEIYLTAIDLGGRLFLPAGFFQPYIGVGVTGGFFSVSDPTNRNNHTMAVVFDKESKVIRGTYTEAGADLVFGDFGLRYGAQWSDIETDRFDNLQKAKVKFKNTLVKVGIMLFL